MSARSPGSVQPLGRRWSANPPRLGARVESSAQFFYPGDEVVGGHGQ